MADETKLREQAARGADAAQLRDHPLLKEFFANLKADCIRSWINTPIDGDATREDAWRMHKAIELVENKLVTAAANGEHARKQLLEKQEQKEK